MNLAGEYLFFFASPDSETSQAYVFYVKVPL